MVCVRRIHFWVSNCSSKEKEKKKRRNLGLELSYLLVWNSCTVTPGGSRSDPIGGSEPKSGARDYLYYILYYILGLLLTCSFSELNLYLWVYQQFL